MNTNLDRLTAADLRRAADLTEKIEDLQAELALLLSGKKKPGRKPVKKRVPKKVGAKKKAAKKKRTMSAAGRERIRLAQKKRWAKEKAKKKAAKKKA